MQNAPGCAKVRGVSSNKKVYSGSSDRVVQQPTTQTIMNMTDLRANVSHSPPNQKSDLKPYTIIYASIDSCCSIPRPILSHSSEYAIVHVKVVSLEQVLSLLSHVLR